MKIEDIIPAALYSDSPMDKLVYARDASEFEGACTGVVWPTSKDHIVQLVQLSKRNGYRFTLRGAATSTHGGCVPAEAIVIDLSKMNKVIDVGSDWALVEAGCVLDDLNSALKRKIFPLIPLEHRVCTIGGMIATNTWGLDRSLGRMEDWVLELEVIDGNGRSLKISGQNLKHFVGAEGITGVIVTAKLRILEREAMKKSVGIFTFNTLTALMEKVMILDKVSNVKSIEYYDEHCSKLMELEPALHILVEYHDDTGPIKDSDEIGKIEELKEKLQHTLIRQHFMQKEDPKVPLEEMGKFLNWLRKNGTPCYGHLKSGVLHPCFREYSKLSQEMLGVLETVRGDVVGEYPIGLRRKKYLAKDKTMAYKTLKNQYDPNKIFNRGVLVD